MIMFVVMKAYITTCCAEKSTIKGKIPILKRYESIRIEKVYQLSVIDGVNFFVLSGKYGLLSPADTIPYYDYVLTASDVPLMVSKIKQQLLSNQISEITLFANIEWVNYIKVMQEAAKENDLIFNLKLL